VGEGPFYKRSFPHTPIPKTFYFKKGLAGIFLWVRLPFVSAFFRVALFKDYTVNNHFDGHPERTK
jgi:hypothetical protein